MKYTILFFLFFSVLLNAQVKFQEGYIIDNSDKKIQCLIKNMDWKQNPKSIIYKLNEDSSEETLVVNDLKEFQIYDTDNFYKRYPINKAVTGNFYEKMQLTNDLVLLKVLVDGETDLCELHSNGTYYFFYQKNDQLVLLDYEKKVDDNNKIRENSNFRKQLFDNFKCNDFTIEDYSKLKYNSTALSNFFSQYNQCLGEDYANLNSQRTKAKVNFKLRGGLNLNTSQTNQNASSIFLTFTVPPFSGNPQGDDVVVTNAGIENYNTNNSFSLGAELELLLPFAQNMWSVFIAPNYHNVSEIKGERNFSVPVVEDFEVTSSLSYAFIQIPIGIRRYFYLNDKMQLYTHVAYAQNVILSSDKNMQLNNLPEPSTSYSFGIESNVKKRNSGGYFGLGIIFSNKYAIDINYYALNLNLNDFYQVNMKGFAINASYTIF